MNELPQIVLIGAGNVGVRFGKALYEKGYEIRQIFSRTENSAHPLAKSVEASATSDLSNIDTEADLYLVAVSDEAIPEVAKQLKLIDKVVVHTSGMVERSALTTVSDQSGVLYPFQTLSKDRAIDFEKVPLFIETEDKTVRKMLQRLAESLGSPATDIEQQQRQVLHIAGVWANNFPNYMWQIAYQLLEEENISSEHLTPLIRETVEKLDELPPDQAQTGPAARGDRSTITNHMGHLRAYPRWRNLYRVITESLQADFSTQPTAQKGVLNRMKDVTTFVFDLDGVLTDGMGIVTNESQVLRKLNSKDAFALQLAAKQGYNIAVISGSTPTGVPPRLERLGIESIYTQSADKEKVFDQYLQEHGVKAGQVLFMGDDIPDLKLFEHVGVATCPDNAAGELVEEAHYVSNYAGGGGAVRDVIEKVMKLQGEWWCEDIHVW